MQQHSVLFLVINPNFLLLLQSFPAQVELLMSVLKLRRSSSPSVSAASEAAGWIQLVNNAACLHKLTGPVGLM